MDFKKLSATSATLALGLTLVACDSDSSSGPQSDPAPTSSQENTPASSSDVTGARSSSSVNPLSSNTLKSSSSEMSVSSSSAECFTKGMANITMRNMERTSISCPNSYTIYDYDLQILYKCEGTALIEIDMPPCESDEPESSASVTAPAVDYGTLADSRDGKSYKTVKIGNLTWMAENLNFDNSATATGSIDSSFCYDGIPANCTKYGRLYQEYAATAVCPEGWRLPTADDWRDLTTTAKSEFGDNNGSLRAVGQWEDTIFGDNITATNASGFSAIPAGYRAKTGECDGEGKKAYFWGEDNMNHYAWILSNQYDMEKESMQRGYYAYAVRCVKD